ncbi:MAG: spore coat associated protein CotJA [Clostridium sp.]|nr:spore coat associated protein CotJA [Clostridium sp.]
MQDYRCDEHNDKIDQYPLAMAYVPWQHFEKIYDNLEEAYRCGTIFPELNKPFTGRRCV